MVAWQEFLESNPNICGGELCTSETRIPVTVILDSLAEKPWDEFVTAWGKDGGMIEGKSRRQRRAR